MAASADMRARDVMKLKEILGNIEDPTIRSSGLELLENIISSDDSSPQRSLPRQSLQPSPPK